MKVVTAQCPGGSLFRALVSRARRKSHEQVPPPGPLLDKQKPLQSQGQQTVPEELEGQRGVSSYRAGRGVRAFLLHGGIRDPPIQGRLWLEAVVLSVVLSVHLWPGLRHLLQTLPGNERRECISQGCGQQQWDSQGWGQQLRAGTLAPRLRCDPGYRARGWCME